VIITKSAAELEIMREAGRITARTLRIVGEAVRPGVSTAELDALAEDVHSRWLGRFLLLRDIRAFRPLFCTSVNEQVVHGIPSKKRVLHEGEILSVDCGAIVDGYYGDSAMTFPVGAVSTEARRLMDATQASLAAGIEYCRIGFRLHDISAAVQAVAEKNGFSVVREYVGHGIGRSMHEDPQVPNYGKPRNWSATEKRHGSCH